VTAAIFSLAAVWIHGRMRGSHHVEQPQARVAMSWWQWTWRLALIAFSWVVLFVLCGALVFLPLAGALAPEALDAYTNMEMPAWILPFQALRAVLMAALILPLIRMMKGRRWETGLAVALLYSILMASNLLRPTGMHPGLQLAHLVEVLVENLIFGWIVGWLLYPGPGRQPVTRTAGYAGEGLST
jgi:hypothetical protein